MLNHTAHIASMSLPPADYSSPHYWNERYQKDGDYFEWYQDADTLKHLLHPLLTALQQSATTNPQQPPSILVLGSGTSQLSEYIYTTLQSYNIKLVCLDFSSVVVERMRQLNLHKYPALASSYVCGDVRQMADQEQWQKVLGTSVTAQQFDLIIDKGCLDSILTSPTAVDDIQQTLRGIRKWLKPESGIFWSVSHAKLESRQYIYDNLNTTNDPANSDNNYTLRVQSVTPVQRPKIGNQPQHATDAVDEQHHVYVLTKVAR